jgi:hypothetical protein
MPHALQGDSAVAIEYTLGPTPVLNRSNLAAGLLLSSLNVNRPGSNASNISKSAPIATGASRRSNFFHLPKRKSAFRACARTSRAVRAAHRKPRPTPVEWSWAALPGSDDLVEGIASGSPRNNQAE